MVIDGARHPGRLLAVRRTGAATGVRHALAAQCAHGQGQRRLRWIRSRGARRTTGSGRKPVRIGERRHDAAKLCRSVRSDGRSGRAGRCRWATAALVRSRSRRRLSTGIRRRRRRRPLPVGERAGPRRERKGRLDVRADGASDLEYRADVSDLETVGRMLTSECPGNLTAEGRLTGTSRCSRRRAAGRSATCGTAARACSRRRRPMTCGCRTGGCQGRGHGRHHGQPAGDRRPADRGGDGANDLEGPDARVRRKGQR